jgi:hypothetical protein
MTKFVVDLGKLHISDEKKDEISASIHKAVLSHLTSIPRATESEYITLKRPFWWGFILRESLDELRQFEEETGRRG